ncbi:GDSL-type esterase/lipase family protein [Rhodanobacter ginsenosidimutans]|uniref:GDSL-type esterase/lipase family protein n=1 Tax=Rhodanobacter ginsenosidimutans TaxID=490571 RepID=A0ABW0JV60_9GAMM
MKSLHATLFALFTLVAIPLASSAHGVGAATPPTRTVLLVGDSLSSAHRTPAEAGWVNLLQQRVSAASTTAPKIINASRGGKTLTDALKELPGLIAAHHPRLVILELGANDAILGASRQQLETDMTRLIDMAQASGAKVAVLGFRIPPKLDKDHCADMLAGVYQRIQHDKQIVLLPSLMAGISDQPALLLDDGVHPGVDAQKLLLDNTWATLRPLLLN